MDGVTKTAVGKRNDSKKTLARTANDSDDGKGKKERRIGKQRKSNRYIGK
jgi:hypothetical protein